MRPSFLWISSSACTIPFLVLVGVLREKVMRCGHYHSKIAQSATCYYIRLLCKIGFGVTPFSSICTWEAQQWYSALHSPSGLGSRRWSAVQKYQSIKCRNLDCELSWIGVASSTMTHMAILFRIFLRNNRSYQFLRALLIFLGDTILHFFCFFCTIYREVTSLYPMLKIGQCKDLFFNLILTWYLLLFVLFSVS